MNSSFAGLIFSAQRCQQCPAMIGQSKALSAANGPTGAIVMLVGEAPGRRGAARTGIPFHGDESGRRLNRLIAAAGWRRDDLFITNAVLCNPLDDRGRNRPPAAAEVANCSCWLRRQIELVDPLLVVALGAIALRGLNRIEGHALTVRNAGEPPVPWHGRHLAACYHPSARAAIHRRVESQLEDFRKLGAWQAANAGSAGLR